MRSSTSLALATAAALALSLGLKAALFTPSARQGSPPVPTRSAALRQFLAAQADSPLEPVAQGWAFSKAGCRLIAFPPSIRGMMDIVPQREARQGDRLLYVYRGRIQSKPPTLAVGLDVLAYMAAKPFRGGAEPGYVVLIVRDCAGVPALPWAQLPT